MSLFAISSAAKNNGSRVAFAIMLPDHVGNARNVRTESSSPPATP